MLIEPALRETSRDLLAIRDRLVPAGFFVVAPCLLPGRPVPRWSTSATGATPAPPGRPSRRRPRAGQSRVDYSYLVLARAGEPSTERRLFRVVSDPIVEKGRLRLWGCGPAGRHPLVRLDRDRTDANRAFDGPPAATSSSPPTPTRAGDGLRIGPHQPGRAALGSVYDAEVGARWGPPRGWGDS